MRIIKAVNGTGQDGVTAFIQPWIWNSTTSMQTFAEVQEASSAAYRTLGDLEWEVESTTVTHSSADWWDL